MADVFTPLRVHGQEVIPYGTITIEIIYVNGSPQKVKILKKEPAWTARDVDQPPQE